MAFSQASVIHPPTHTRTHIHAHTHAKYKLRHQELYACVMLNKTSLCLLISNTSHQNKGKMMERHNDDFPQSVREHDGEDLFVKLKGLLVLKKKSH